MFHRLSTKSSYIRIEGFERPAVEPPELPEPVAIRHAADEDSARIRTLAHLDDRRLPAGPYLVGELAGEIVAAISLSTGEVVADPFRRTAQAADMLRLRAAQIAERRAADAAHARRQTLRPATAH